MNVDVSRIKPANILATFVIRNPDIVIRRFTDSPAKTR